MLRSLIAFCLSRRPLVLISFAAFLALGYAAFTALNIEAYPDPAPPIIEIIAQNPGQSPEEMERYVTIPIEIAVASTPGLKYIRSNTVYALSFVRLQFEYGRDYYFVRQQTINRLKDATAPHRRAARHLAGRRHQRDLPLRAARAARAWTSCSSRRCRTGWWSASCASCPASPTSTCSAARPRSSRSRSISTA